MIEVKAFAKINLKLNILNRRDDGCHEISSLMQSVSLFDLIRLEEISDGIKVECNSSQVPQDETNIAYKAAKMFFEQLKNQKKTGIKISIEKNIPLKAGLGGGSADAAAVLIGLNQIYRNIFDEDKLMQMGSKVGADVPFCLVGGHAEVRGIGEKVKVLEQLFPFYVVIIKPDFDVSTKWAYEQWDEYNNKKLLKTNQNSDNDLEQIIADKYSQVNEIKKKLMILGCHKAQMTGSGSAIFGLINGEDRAEKIYSALKKQFKAIYLCHPVNCGTEILA